MPCMSLVWRRLIRLNHVLGLCLIIVLLNTTFLRSGYSRDKCTSKSKDTSYNGKISYREVQLHSRRENRTEKSTLTNLIGDYSNPANLTNNLSKWREEMDTLLDLIPVLEWNSSSTIRNRSETPLFEKMELFQPLDDLLSINEIESVLLQSYNPIIPGKTTFDLSKAYRDQMILNCKNIEYLERREQNPMITYSFQGRTNKRGELRLRDGQTINIVTKNFRRGESDKSDQDYETAKTEFFKLLKMQHWPGIPRIYGVCITTDNNIDIMTVKSKSQKERSFRYIVDRYDDAFPICFSRQLNDECVELTKLRNFVKGSTHPSLSALKIMKGVAAAFERFSMKGVFPYNISLNEIVVTKSNDVIFTNIKPFIFLEEKPLKYEHYKRLLSNFMCRRHEDCPTPGRQNGQLFFRLGQHCSEVNGHCGDDKRCWGIDSSTYLCIFSKWMFRQLQQLVPTTWKYYTYIINLLECTDQPIPDHRCGWTTFLRGMENLIQYGTAEWGVNSKV